MLLFLIQYKQLKQPSSLNLHVIRKGIGEDMINFKIIHDDNSLFLD